ncbi:hypothetical protein BG004_004429 [Podila humilis]|nr:hypothetical protein BG004_004429 [Podila humilis]
MVKDIQFVVAKHINNAHVSEGHNWTWNDVKNTIAYVKKQYRKAKAMKEMAREGSFVSLPERTLRARMLKVCPEFDRLDAVLSTNSTPFLQRTGSDTEPDTVILEDQNGIGDGNFGYGRSEAKALDSGINSFNGGDTDADELPARKRRKYVKTKADASVAVPIAVVADAVRTMTEKQIEHLGNYRSDLRQREEIIEQREREITIVLMERDVVARKRLDEELEIKKEQFINELAKEKEEFYKDMIAKKERFYKQISQQKDEFNKDMAQRKE